MIRVHPHGAAMWRAIGIAEMLKSNPATVADLVAALFFRVQLLEERPNYPFGLF